MTRLMICETNLIRIATRCRTEEQFVATFARYVVGDAFFVPTLATQAHGFDRPFVFVLVDGRPVLRGIAYVRDSWRTTANPFGVPGILFGIRNLGLEGSDLLDRMRERNGGTLSGAAGSERHAREHPAIVRRYVTLVPRRPPVRVAVDAGARPDEELDIFALPTRVDNDVHARAARSVDAGTLG